MNPDQAGEKMSDISICSVVRQLVILHSLSGLAFCKLQLAESAAEKYSAKRI
jgi:hypothetical protein